MSTQGRPIAPRAKNSWSASPEGAAAVHRGRFGDEPNMGRAVRRRRLRGVLDIGIGTVAAGGGLGVPFAVGGLVFDRLGAARHALLGGNPLGGGKGRGMGRERL